jgi:alternative ribosome-rescue factor
MVTRLNKNPVLKNLYTKKFKPKIVRPKKGKGSFIRLKKVK